jgi:hypothetical protein
MSLCVNQMHPPRLQRQCRTTFLTFHYKSEPHTNLQLHQVSTLPDVFGEFRYLMSINIEGARLQGTIPKSVFGPHVTTVFV